MGSFLYNIKFCVKFVALVLLRKRPSGISIMAEHAVLFEHRQPLCVLIPLLLGTAFLVDGSFNPFLYFRF